MAALTSNQKASPALPEEGECGHVASLHCNSKQPYTASGKTPLTPTSGDGNAGVRVTEGDKAILQEQPLVVMGAIADEHLLVLPAA